MEETGLEVKADKLIAVLDRDKQDLDPYPYSIVTAFVACTALGGSFHANHETDDAEFFDLDSLPMLPSMRTNREQS